MTQERWLLAFGLWLVLALVAPGADAIAQTVSTGQPIDQNEDANGFQLWHTIGAGGVASSPASSLDYLGLGGSIGQAVSGSPNALSDLWVVAGFWGPSVSYDSTEVDPSDSTDVDVTLGIGGTVNISLGFSLAPIFPNPSHGLAYVQWTVPRTSNVRLTVHDVQGREAAVLANGSYPAGSYGMRWNTLSTKNPLAAGIYFIRLETPEGVFTRRVIMIR